MLFVLNDFVYAMCYALSCIEHELLGVARHHSARVACMSVLIGQKLQLSEQQLRDLAVCAALHDNALSEYLQAEVLLGNDEGNIHANEILAPHCELGETNLAQLPLYPRVKNVLLYHHENANGSGPFGKAHEEIPLLARIIHLADRLDARFDLTVLNAALLDDMARYMHKKQGIVFEPACVSAALQALPGFLAIPMADESIYSYLTACLPAHWQEYSNEELIRMAHMMAQTIDYKSAFTCRHSLGIAQKARAMAIYYGFDENEQAKLYVAGALHDVGKLLISNDILEKPDKLTPEEFGKMRHHALATYQILQRIRGFEDITLWASMHHEKLDGSGYPFGKTGRELSRNERLLACLDIYQALVEARPYREGVTHRAAMNILDEMAFRGQLNTRIVEDLGHCFGV